MDHQRSLTKGPRDVDEAAFCDRNAVRGKEIITELEPYLLRNIGKENLEFATN